MRELKSKRAELVPTSLRALSHCTAQSVRALAQTGREPEKGGGALSAFVTPSQSPSTVTSERTRLGPHDRRSRREAGPWRAEREARARQDVSDAQRRGSTSARAVSLASARVEHGPGRVLAAG